MIKLGHAVLEGLLVEMQEFDAALREVEANAMALAPEQSAEDALRLRRLQRVVARLERQFQERRDVFDMLSGISPREYPQIDRLRKLVGSIGRRMFRFWGLGAPDHGAKTLVEEAKDWRDLQSQYKHLELQLSQAESGPVYQRDLYQAPQFDVVLVVAMALEIVRRWMKDRVDRQA